MFEYVLHIVAPYVEKVCESFQPDTSALVIIDHLKGQIIESVTVPLEQYMIHVCLLLTNTTDRLQHKDVSVNKPAKDHLKS